MAKDRLKPWSVGKHTIYDPTQTPPRIWRTVEIMFDRDDLDFFAEIGSGEIHAPSVTELRQQIDKYSASLATLEWEPVIWIKADEPWRSSREDKSAGSGFQIEVNRLHRAVLNDDTILVATWNMPVEERFNPNKQNVGYIPGSHLLTEKQSLKLPRVQYKNSGYEYLVPYDEDLYNGLLRMVEQIHEMRDKITELLADAHGRDMVARAGKMLTLTGGMNEDQ